GRAERRWLGLALTPQAGVAIGMALVAGDRFPSLADTLLTVAVASTVAFELIGPVFVALALRRADAGAPAAAKPPAASGPEPRA
ncbi:MAG: cation:proton antiporter, partial [Pseudomonadota bacterium]